MNKKYTYTNISKQTQTLIGYGVIEPGKHIQVDHKINNPNFRLKKNKRLRGVDPVSE